MFQDVDGVILMLISESVFSASTWLIKERSVKSVAAI